MGITQDNCGHPKDWVLRLVYNGTIYTYCMGCVVERAGLDNLEAYSNPFIKIATDTTVKKTATKKNNKD